MYLSLGVSSMIILCGGVNNINGFSFDLDEYVCEASDVNMAKGCSSEIGITVGVIIMVGCLVVVVITITVILCLWR